MRQIILDMLYETDATLGRQQLRDLGMEKSREFDKNLKGLPFRLDLKSRRCSIHFIFSGCRLYFTDIVYTIFRCLLYNYI